MIKKYRNRSTYPRVSEYRAIQSFRRFFENTTTSARITGVDEELINRFHIILQTISSGEAINIAKFRMYTIETAKYFVEKYRWYKMPTGVHRLLIHGPDIIAAALLPTGVNFQKKRRKRLIN